MPQINASSGPDHCCCDKSTQDNINTSIVPSFSFKQLGGGHYIIMFCVSSWKGVEGGGGGIGGEERLLQ